MKTNEKNLWRVTYEIVTPESAEHGDSEENGFVDAGGGLWPIAECTDDLNFGMSLREALRICHPGEDCGGWFVECEGDIDYATGAVTRKSLHPPANLSAASYARISKLLRL